jgi:HAD superfamily hydrolase (TIGR01549 family)
VTLARPRLLLLDAGNTVVFIDHTAVAEAACGVGVPVTGAQLHAIEGIAKLRYGEALGVGLSHEDGWHLYMRVLFETAGVERSDADRAAVAARAAHDLFNLWRRVPVDLRQALERAQRAGVRTGIVSNSEGQLARLLERVGISDLFELVVDSGLEGVHKPDPEIFRRALARCGVAAHEALYAGDIPHVDVDGARAAGISAVLIDPWDHFPHYQAAPRFASVAELVEALGV